MENENENFELDSQEQPSAGNKDLWLYLIVLDLICLCVFGFFLYKNLSARVFNAPETDQPAVVAAAEETVTPAALETAVVEETVIPAPVKEAVPAAEPQEEVTSVLAQALPSEEVQQPSAEEQPAAQPAQTEQKQSVLVEDNPKSKKYRRVTFRWFGDAKKVAVVSGFTMSKPQSLKKKKGYWETTLSIAPGSYKFLYIVDGVNTVDPYSPQKDGRSVLEVK